MGDESEVRVLLEEVLNSGKTPEEVCGSHPELLEEVRTRWLRIRDLAGDLERAFPSSGPRGRAATAKPEIQERSPAFRAMSWKPWSATAGWAPCTRRRI